jgi:hypothetical protein
MLLPMCCCVSRRCCHLCIPCSVVPVVLALSVFVSSMADLPCLPLPQLSLTMGPSGEPSDNDVNNNPVGEPRHLAGRASQTSTAPSRLCHACGPYLSTSLSLSVLSSRNAPLKVLLPHDASQATRIRQSENDGHSRRSHKQVQTE